MHLTRDQMVDVVDDDVDDSSLRGSRAAPDDVGSPSLLSVLLVVRWGSVFL